VNEGRHLVLLRDYKEILSCSTVTLISLIMIMMPEIMSSQSLSSEIGSLLKLKAVTAT